MSVSRRDLLKIGTLSLFGSAGPSSGKNIARPNEPLLGVNLAGAEFDLIGGRWKWPLVNNIRYYIKLGIRIFRIPFKWDRIQPNIEFPIQKSSLSGLDLLIHEANKSEATIILDMHDYGRRGGSVIGLKKARLEAEAFAKFWGALAKIYGRNPRIWYGLMNEPHDQDPELNLRLQNAACQQIRANGALGKVLFSGIAWTGAHSWIASSNGDVMLGALDPQNNFCFDMHQYFDVGFSGSSPVPIRNIGKTILNESYGWALENSKQIFIGEFASGSDPDSLKELSDFLRFIVDRPDVYVGGTYWAGGGGWGDQNITTVDPRPSDPKNMRSQLKVLLNYI